MDLGGRIGCLECLGSSLDRGGFGVDGVERGDCDDWEKN